MAYGFADIPQAERDLIAADKPRLIGRNWGRTATTLRWDADGDLTAGADVADASFPSKRIKDDQSYLVTKPSGSAVESPPGTWNRYFAYDFGSEGMEIDAVALLKHNLGTLTGVTVDIRVADNAAFVTNNRIIETFTPGSSNKRLVSVSLEHGGGIAQRYTTVRYLMIHLKKGADFTPEFGEFIIGRSRQFKHTLKIPYARRRLRSRWSDFEAASGAGRRYGFHKNRRPITGSINPSETAYIDDLETLFKTETDGGKLPILWVEKPGTAPSDAWWVRYMNPDLQLTNVDFTEHEVPLDFLEVGPDFLAAET